jgi:hypothetical protein
MPQVINLLSLSDPRVELYPRLQDLFAKLYHLTKT